MKMWAKRCMLEQQPGSGAGRDSLYFNQHGDDFMLYFTFSWSSKGNVT